MPSRHVIREFKEDGYYHVFNRGVEKRLIFQDKQDYKMLLYYLFIYLVPLEKVLLKYPLLPIRLYNKNLSKEVELVCFCLMPNHFHFLLHQTTQDATSKLMKQIMNGYTHYFNQKYKRVGPLVQGVFKAVDIPSDEIFVHISRYIHLNPVTAGLTDNLEDYKWSSYPEYLGQKESSLSRKERVLDLFSSAQDYKNFIQDQIDYAKSLDSIKHLLIED